MKTDPKEGKANIISHRKIASDYYCLRFHSPEIARLAQPGQFVMLQVNELRDPLLRRPFSFSRILMPKGKGNKLEDGGILEICYKVVGRGTSLMTQLQEGQRINLLGPLGRGFWAVEGSQRAILIGGGIGMAPLIPWGEELRRRTRKKQGSSSIAKEIREVIILIGGNSREAVLGIRECCKIGCEPQVATEDGSMGIRGVATDLLERELMTRGHQSAALYACGPMPMLNRIAQIAEQFDLPCQVLMESRMACGVGACLGCAVKVKEETMDQASENQADHARTGTPHPDYAAREGTMDNSREGLLPRIAEVPAFRYARACKEGPVFESRKILWD